MRRVYYHDFSKDDIQYMEVSNNFLNKENEKLKVKVWMFDCLAGLGYGFLEDGKRVHLNALNIVTKNCGLGLALDEEILADIEILEDGDLFARNIERDIKR